MISKEGLDYHINLGYPKSPLFFNACAVSWLILFSLPVQEKNFPACFLCTLHCVFVLYTYYIFASTIFSLAGRRDKITIPGKGNEQPNQDPCFVGWGRGHLIWSSQREVIDDIESMPTITAPLARSGLFLRQPLSKGGCIWCRSFRPLTGAIWV